MKQESLPGMEEEQEAEEQPSVGDAYIAALPRIRQNATEWAKLGPSGREWVLTGLRLCQQLSLLGEALVLPLEEWRETDALMDAACTKAEAIGRAALGIDILQQAKDGNNKTLAVKVFEMLSEEDKGVTSRTKARGLVKHPCNGGASSHE